MAIVDGELKQLIDEAYGNILQTANRALRNCKLFSIEMLQQEDPSYEVIALHLEEVAKIIEVVHEAYPNDIEGFRTAVKAQEYAQNIANIAGAIKVGDNEKLQTYIEELDRRPFL